MSKGKYIRRAVMAMSLIAAISCLASASWATTYYVSPSGSNGNNGTSSSTPYQTIQQALNTVRAGDTVNIMAGTYNAGLVLMTSGTNGAPITVQSYNGASVTINSGNSRAVCLTNSSGSINYYTIKGLTFISNYSSYSGAVNSGWKWTLDFSSGYWPGAGAAPTTRPSHFVVDSCNITGGVAFMGSYNTVTNCTMNGNNQWADAIYASNSVSNHNTATYNTIHNYTNRAFHSESGASYDVASYNTVYSCGAGGNGGAIDFDGAYTAVTYGTANYNTIYNCTYSAIQFENGLYGTAIGNTIYNCGTGIIAINYGLTGGGQIADSEYRSKTSKILLANNSISGCKGGGIAFIQSSGNFVYNNSFYNVSNHAIDCTTGGVSSDFSAGNEIIQNNIFSNSASIEEMTVSGTQPNTIDHNIFYNTPTAGQNVITGNPNYANPTATPPNLSIGSGSAAIKAGISIPAVTTDILGNPRLGSAYDIGAYQYGQAVALQLSPPTGLTVQ